MVVRRIETHQIQLDSPELQRLADQIHERNRILHEGNGTYWLANGRDLQKAKSFIGHGNFEKWCLEKLSYGRRTAQKLMSAADHFKNASGAVSLPLSLIYAVSAPAIPQAIKENFIPRAIAGEDVCRELRAALKHYRKTLKQPSQTSETALIHLAVSQAISTSDTAQTGDEVCKNENAKETQLQMLNARSAALDLILTSMADALPTILEFAANAGLGNVFNVAFENELRLRVQSQFNFDKRDIAELSIATEHVLSDAIVSELAGAASPTSDDEPIAVVSDIADVTTSITALPQPLRIGTLVDLNRAIVKPKPKYDGQFLRINLGNSEDRKRR